jgi:uncharacterized protein
MEKQAMNPVVWFEIYVQDMQRAKAFYETVFGHKLTKIDNPGLEMLGFPSEFSAFGCSGALVKMDGVGGQPKGLGTMVYFGSEDCAELEKIQQAGGKLIKGKESIGQYGFIVIAEDTEGNVIGLHSMK